MITYVAASAAAALTLYGFYGVLVRRRLRRDRASDDPLVRANAAAVAAVRQVGALYEAVITFAAMTAARFIVGHSGWTTVLIGVVVGTLAIAPVSRWERRRDREIRSTT